MIAERVAPIALASLIGVLPACDLHGEVALRAGLEQYFALGDTLSFESRMTCTAAIFRAATNDVKPDMPMAAHPELAQALYGTHGKAAIQIYGRSPHELTDAMLASSDSRFGKQALAAAAQVMKCLTDGDSKDFRRALTRPSAVLAYDSELDGVIVLDPVERKLFFAAGDSF